MNPTQQQEDNELQNKDFPLKVMQPGERVLCEIRRHPFGLFGLYFTLILVILVAVLVVVAAPKVFTGITSHDQAVLALGAVIICAITGLFTYVGVSVYKGNRWLVTSDSITQINQISLLNKQTSQLSLANLEDVTVEQNGILQSMFGFGRLRAETAGERGKFIFDFCPKPQDYAKEILAAHEAYIAEKPGEMHVTNQALANTSSFNQSYAQPQYGQPTQQPYEPAQPQPGPGMPPMDPVASSQQQPPQPGQ
jgi:hypothetical protein